jgi:hypothetical protein
MPEMEIEADGRAADAELPNQNARDEVLGAQGGESLVEGEHQCAVEPGHGEQAQFRAGIRETKHRVGRAQYIARVRLEGHGDGRAPERRRARDRRIDHCAMAAMYAVEIADRRDRPRERGLRCVIVGNAERLFRRGRFGHVR